MTRTKSSRALLSVVLAVLMVAAFMPALTYSSFAATAKKATKVTKLTHTGAKVYGKVGNKYVLKYKLSPSKLTSAAKKTAWKSSDSSIVKVYSTKSNRAAVKAKAEGTAKVTVYTKANKKAKATWTFKVTKKAETKTTLTGVTVAANNAADYTKVLTVGTKLTATVAPADAKDVTYQWQADGQDIAGATASEYTVTSDQIGKAITVKATSKNTVTSTASAKVAKVKLNDSAVTIEQNGKTLGRSVKIGDVLKAKVAGKYVDNNGATKDIDLADSVTYQWYRVNKDGNNTAIDGATAQSYTATAADAGYKLRVIVTPKTNVEGSVQGAFTPEVAEAVKADKALKITLTTSDTPKLTVTAKDAKGNAVKFASGDVQWAESANGTTFTAINSATSPEYSGTLTAGHTYKVTVTNKTIADQLTASSATYVYSGKTLTTTNASIRNNTKTLNPSQTAVKVGDELQVIGVTDGTNSLTYGTDYTVTWYSTKQDLSHDAKLDKLLAQNLGTAQTYKLTANENGKTIVAVITGAGNYAGQDATIVGGDFTKYSAVTTQLTLSYDATAKKLVVKDANGAAVTGYTVVKTKNAAPELTFAKGELTNTAASLEGYSYYVKVGSGASTVYSNKITFNADGTATAAALTADDINA